MRVIRRRWCGNSRAGTPAASIRTRRWPSTVTGACRVSTRQSKTTALRRPTLTTPMTQSIQSLMHAVLRGLTTTTIGAVELAVYLIARQVVRASTSPPVSFGYDSAGNLTSMTDGSGGTTYQYNSLSQVVSETHQLNGLSASYTLAYEYNLAGELKTFTDQHAGTSVNYGFDSSGRTTGVSGSGFGSVTQLASNSKYRAWGALSHEEYGNGVQI